ncbi:MAG: hypothetical protein KF882_09760 [Bacteroidia bacterium]|nr:hypothetical protein [Bacteroidia bacterium]
MKTKTTLLLLASCLLLLVFSSSRCNRENDDDCIGCFAPQDTLYVPQDFLDYWYAETGSWWVFKRTDTVGADIYDTMRVKYHERKIKFHHSYGNNAFESIKLHQIHSHKEFKVDDVNYDSEIVLAEAFPTKIHYGWKFPNDSSFYAPYGMLDLSYPFVLYTMETRLLNYRLEDIISLSTPYGILENTLVISDKVGMNIRFYFSENIGISRMETQGGQIWELIDCNIIRTQ